MISSGNDYASALFMLAAESGKLDVFSKDLLVIGGVFRENPDYTLLLSSPSVPKNERMQIIDSAFEGKVDEYLVNFINVLCDHGKVDSLENCIKDFEGLKKAAENCVTARVYTAVPLSDAQKSKIKEKLEKRLGSQVIIKTVIDENILGGVKIELDGKVIDGSIKRQLHDIKEVISK